LHKKIHVKERGWQRNGGKERKSEANLENLTCARSLKSLHAPKGESGHTRGGTEGDRLRGQSIFGRERNWAHGGTDRSAALRSKYFIAKSATNRGLVNTGEKGGDRLGLSHLPLCSRKKLYQCLDHSHNRK